MEALLHEVSADMKMAGAGEEGVGQVAGGKESDGAEVGDSGAVCLWLDKLLHVEATRQSQSRTSIMTCEILPFSRAYHIRWEVTAADGAVRSYGG